jgi:hypothetical protein
MTRAVVSVTPPGGNGTSNVTGRDGNVCAEAAPVRPAIALDMAATAAAAQNNFLMFSSHGPDQQGRLPRQPGLSP